MKIVDFILHEKAPIWLTFLLALITAIFGGVGTYLIAPQINARFEVQKAHAQYILDNLKVLNTDTADLFGLIARETQELADGKAQTSSDIEAVRTAVTRLEWRANEYETMFRSSEAKATIKTYSTALSNLGDAADTANKASDVNQLISMSRKLAEASRGLIELLTKQTRWSANFDLTLSVSVGWVREA